MTPTAAPNVRPVAVLPETVSTPEVVSLPDSLHAASIYVAAIAFNASNGPEERAEFLEPSVADAAIADLRIAIADIAVDAITADAAAEAAFLIIDKGEWKSTSTGDESQTFETAWDALAPALLEQ
jgi:hypothetical protein